MGKIQKGLRRDLKKAGPKGTVSALVVFSDARRPYVLTGKEKAICEKALAEICEKLCETPKNAQYYPNLGVLYITASVRFIRALAKHPTVLWADAAPKYRTKRKEGSA